MTTNSSTGAHGPEEAVTPGQALTSTPATPHAGRYVVVRDCDGRRHALARHAVSALCDTEDGGCALLLPGGRVVVVPDTMETVLQMLG